ncbi:hypothetical protein [Mumia sp. DW29H23]|uniref:hypothetical protein n=1 Tax=Mumia sp. DW29H23 TaxID=3421241 RepID=UPI003D688B4A
MGASYWGNEELGSLTKSAKSGHGTASEDASSSATRHLGRTQATEGLNVGPTGNAQRAAHTALAAAKQANANNVAEVGTNVNRGEQAQAQTTEESSSLQKVSATDGESTATSLRRTIQA